jgi:hypothetical protein
MRKRAPSLDRSEFGVRTILLSIAALSLAVVAYLFG